MASPRVRFAPSPTGFFHLGSARTALFNWLYARHTGGTFILRIEDTDRQRNTPEALRVLLDGMRWLGLDWDEGPEVGGPCGPYFQSERSAIYREFLGRLERSGRVYEKEGAVYFRLEGERYTVHDSFRGGTVEKVRAQPVVIEDAVRGRVERAEDQDFVVFRSNGEPVFHFVNVVDDILMGVTHVIRGEDHLSNTSKHIELYRAFSAPLPVFAHIPLILKSHGPGKMSKRDQGALLEDYQKKSYLPAAVRNYLSLLGWNPKDDREIMDLPEIIAAFDLPGINRDNARFDEKKMEHFNTEHLRRLPLPEFARLAREVMVEAGWPASSLQGDYWLEVMRICQDKVRQLADITGFCLYFLTDDFPMDPKAQARVLGRGAPLARLSEVAQALSPLDSWSEERIEGAIHTLAEKNGLNPADYFAILRLAVSGVSGGPSLFAVLQVLGRETALRRIERFLASAGAGNPS